MLETMRRLATMKCRKLFYFICCFAFVCSMLLLILYHFESYQCESEPVGPNHYREEIVDDDSILRKRRYLRVRDIPVFRAKNISCVELFRGDEFARVNGVFLQRTVARVTTSEDQYRAMTADCKSFRRSRRYARYAGSEEEARFPIAYSILVYTDVEQFERLFRAVYRPQNHYCVHVDAKSPPSFRSAVESIVGCFNNAFVTARSVDVRWGMYSVLEPELICMEELWKKSKAWRYLINLTGQEFPLRTNRELVKILQVYNGSNNVEGTILKIDASWRDHMGIPPCNIRMVKGSVHVTASRAFVNYILHSPVALSLRTWVKKVEYYAEEVFFSSLNHSPHLGVPGAYTGVPETDSTVYRFITRFKNWGDPPFDWPCPGRRWIRQICILSIGDLPLLLKRPELFANKFLNDYHPLALDCMEELHYNRTRWEIEADQQQGLHSNLTGGIMRHDLQYNFDLDFYKNLDFVKNRVE